MDIIKEQVWHGKYGPGVVVGQADNIITVKFASENDTKKFLYPSVFEHFMKLCSDVMQAKQAEEIARRRAEYEADIAQRHAEEEQRRINERTAVKAKKKVSAKRHKAPKDAAEE